MNTNRYNGFSVSDLFKQNLSLSLSICVRVCLGLSHSQAHFALVLLNEKENKKDRNQNTKTENTKLHTSNPSMHTMQRGQQIKQKRTTSKTKIAAFNASLVIVVKFSG